MARGRRHEKTQGPVFLTGEEIIKAASGYPPMIVTMCYDSAEILAGVYPELRIVEGIRSAELAGAAVSRQIEHGWCIREDGMIIDSVFTEEIAANPSLDPATIKVTYAEQALPGVEHSYSPGLLRDEIRRRAATAQPPLYTPQQRWRFAEHQRDEWLAAARRAGQ